MGYTLVLVRHGESEWNKLNLFTGWTDIDLTENGHREAREAGQILRKAGFLFDVCYTSYLKRAIHTANHVLEEMDSEWIPVIKSWKLNERHYGALQGFNKVETAEKYGQEQVKLWRRYYDIQPPLLDENDFRNPARQRQYANISRDELPVGESLKQCYERLVPYYEDVILPDIASDRHVLIVAHGSTLRALVKYLDNLSDEAVIELNIPTGVPLVYDFDDNFKPIKHYYLGNESEIAKKITAVANQASLSH